MKIYTRIVVDMASGLVEEAESFEHVGPVAQCGGKDGGSSALPATTTVNTSSIAPEMQPYYTSIMNRAVSATSDPNDPTKAAEYQAYPGQLVAGLSPLQQQSINAGGQLSNAGIQQGQAGIGTINSGSLMTQQGGQGALGVASNAQTLQNSLYGSGAGLLGQGQAMLGGQSANLMNQAGIGALGVGQGASGLASIYSPQNVQQWMSPYQQGVTDIAKEQANRQFAQQQNAAAAQAASHGALGGYRDQLRGAEDQRNQNILLNNIQMQGDAGGYNAALQAMGAQGQQALNAGQLGLSGYGQAGNIGQGIGQLGLGLGTLGVNTTGQSINAGQLGLSGYGQAGTQGVNLADIGNRQAALGQQGLNNLQTLGALQQGQQQNDINAAYSQFQNAQAYPQQQLNFLSGILRGTPQATSSTSAQYQAPPSIYSQLAGLGMAGAGLGSLASKFTQTNNWA